MFEAGTPTAVTGTTAEGQFDVTVDLDETGRFAYVIVPTGEPTPSVSQVLNYKKSDGVPAPSAGESVIRDASTAKHHAVGMNLTNGASYDIHFVAFDDEPTPNVQNTVTSVTNVTAQDIPPTAVRNFMATDDSTGSSKDINFSWNSYYTNDFSKFEIRIKSQVDETVLATVSVTDSSATTATYTDTAGNLSSGTTYDVEIVAIDNASQESTPVTDTVSYTID